MIAQWYPECLSLAGEYDLAVLDTPAFRDLESRIIAALEHSWCSNQKAKLLLQTVVLTRPSVAVEIGAFTGSCTLPMLAGLRYQGHGHAYVIDAWSNEEAVGGLPHDDVNAVWWSGLDMAAIRTQFSDMLDTWALADLCTIVAEPSANAADRVGTIDFLHLDGNFSEAGALLDAELYLPKVAGGGYALLSNALVTVGGLPTKVRSLRRFFEACDIVGELDGGNTLLFRKR